MALSGKSTWKWRPRGSQMDVEVFKVKNSAVVYWGAIVVGEVNVGMGQGYLKPYDDTSGTDDIFLGIARPTGDQVDTSGTPAWVGVTGATSSTPVPVCTVDISGITLINVPVTGVTAQTKVFQPVYASDDQTLTLTAATYFHAIGRVVMYRSSGYGDIKLYSAMEYAAMIDSD